MNRTINGTEIQSSLFDYKPSKGGSFLVAALTGRGWVRAKMLMPLVGMTDRQLRAEAEASDGEIVTGNKGYCLASECRMDDLDHAANRLESQAKKMMARAVKIRNAAHRRIAGRTEAVA